MNTNCLEGYRCPSCGQEDEILVRASGWVSLKDEGTDPFADSVDNRSGTEYDGESDAACPNCDYESKLWMFEIRRQECLGKGKPGRE